MQEQIINFERDKIIDVKIEDGLVTIYFQNGDPKGRTFPYNSLSVSERIELANWFEKNI